jgi:hypothetical protein
MTIANPKATTFSVTVLDENSDQSISDLSYEEFSGERALERANAHFEAAEKAGNGLAIFLNQLVDGKWEIVREAQIGAGISPAKAEMHPN